MNKKLLVYMLLLISLSGLVSAAFSLNGILNPFNGNTIATFYLSYYAFIDALVYLILFLSLSQIAFLKIYSKNNALGPGNNRKESKMIAVAVSIALTVSMTVLEMNTGFNLGQLYPIALVIFLLVLAILLYNLMLGLFTGPKGKNISAALTYLIIYGLLIVPFGTLYRWIEQNVPLLSSILTLGTLAAFIFLIIEMIGLFTGGGDTAGKPGAPGTPGSPGIPGEPGTPGALGETLPSETLQGTTPPNTPTGSNQPGSQGLGPNTSGTNGRALQPLQQMVAYTYSLQTAVARAREFADAAIHVGQQAYLYENNPSTNPPTAADWNKLNQTETNLIHAMQLVNARLDDLLNGSINSLSEGDLVKLNYVMTAHTILSDTIANFYVTFVNNINNDAHPIQLPPSNPFNNMI